MKKASIVIPTFNRAHLVTHAVESALNQTYPCEVVVCDHGSTDNTPSVMEKYKGKVRYIRREEDKGPIVCWRDGIEQATGEIVNITYDDDWLKPTFMEKTISKLDDDIGFVYTNYSLHYYDREDNSRGDEHPPGVGYTQDIAKYLIQGSLTISPGCSIFRKKDVLNNLLLQIPNAKGKYGKNSGVGEDLLLFLLTTRDYQKYFYISEPLACFLYHPGSITIDAMLTENMEHLKDSYTNAKSYYLSLSGSIKPVKGLQKIFFNMKWHYRAGTFIKHLVLRGSSCGSSANETPIERH